MKLLPTPLPGVVILEPVVHGDARGWFVESWNRHTFAALGLDLDFVQDNHSCSRQGVLRGIHYQLHEPQGKLVRVTRGRVFDVAVDMRRASPAFGRWTSLELSAENRRMLWVPPGFGHGLLVLEEGTEVQYKVTARYQPHLERGVRWDDPRLAIPWPLDGAPIVAEKDLALPFLDAAETCA